MRVVKLQIDTVASGPEAFAIRIEGKRGETFMIERVIDGMTGSPESKQTIELRDDQRLTIEPRVAEVRFDKEQNAAVVVPAKTPEEREAERKAIEEASKLPPPSAPEHIKTIDQTAVDAARGDRELAERDSRVKPRTAEEIEEERKKIAAERGAREQETSGQKEAREADLERLANEAKQTAVTPPAKPAAATTAKTGGDAEAKNVPSPNVPPGGPNQVVGTKG